MAASLQARDVLPEPFPLWCGLLGAVPVVGLAYLFEHYYPLSAVAPYFFWPVVWVHAVTIFYLITMIGNYRRLKAHRNDIPDHNVLSLENCPDWFRQSVQMAYASDKHQVRKIGDLHNAIDQNEKSLRTTLQWLSGWLNLLPLAMVAVAFVVSLATVQRSGYSPNSFLPLIVASVEACICIIFMYQYMSLSNNMFSRWNAAEKKFVSLSEDHNLGKYDQSGEGTLDPTGNVGNGGLGHGDPEEPADDKITLEEDGGFTPPDDPPPAPGSTDGPGGKTTEDPDENGYDL